jgi:hypothetical protein
MRAISHACLVASLVGLLASACDSSSPSSRAGSGGTTTAATGGTTSPPVGGAGGSTVPVDTGPAAGEPDGSPATGTGGSTSLPDGGPALDDTAGTGGAADPLDAGSGGATGTGGFISEEPTQTGYPGGTVDGGAAAADAAVGSGTSSPLPGGRVAEVEEADIYKISGSNLFYFNTYRGFLVFDIANPEAPRQVSRLPVFGYPTEMYVSGTTVYALIRDALYLTQVNGKPQFERYNVSQLVAIDITDVSNPTVIKTVDIIGQLREGVSRKIENTIYVVSYIPQSYYYGWSYARPSTAQKEQAWVYSFDVSDPKNPRKVNELQIFEGGSVQFSDGNTSYTKYFSGVAISATSNALMVVENWYVYGYSSAGTYGCGSYDSNQRAVVSIIDVSDPTGNIRRHTRFETSGSVGDQFKMTYVYDEAAQTGTFFAVFARQGWSSSGCAGTSFTQNSLESWDITDGANPVRLARLDFGKPNETVRGTAFDLSRKVLYAITARSVDPMYAISIADPRNLAILSAVDGLSGDISVFNLIGDGKFLMAVGTDTSTTCSGFDATRSQQGTKIAVSIIDVRDLAKVRLVQRQCVTVEGAAWGTGSGITWNLDQARKMIGMHSDAEANTITVPVYYYTKSSVTDWWWYQYQTAVGIMAWDLTKYDDTKNETQQTVLTNYGTFIHPNGMVTRTIVYTHPVTGRRSMLNLSDTHASLADLQDLAHPKQQAIIEIAPYYSEIYRFGDYLVEHVQPKAYTSQEPHEFRVRSTQGGLSAAPLASFVVGQVQRVVKQGANLVLLGYISNSTGSYQGTALIYDLSNPLAPRRAAQITWPTDMAFPYYYYYCGWAPWYSYWWSAPNNWLTTASGLVAVGSTTSYTASSYQTTSKLYALDLSNPDQPRLTTQSLGTTSSTSYYYGGAATLVADAADPAGFYVVTRTKVGEVVRDGTSFTQYRYYAQRWQLGAAGLQAAESVNLPGPLTNTWISSDGQRMFLTREQSYIRQVATNGAISYQSLLGLALLRQTASDQGIAAQLLDTRIFTGLSLSALVREGEKLILTGQPYYYYYSTTTNPSWEMTSARLILMDLSHNRLDVSYDQPTKASSLTLMGTQKDRAFINLPGDGIVVVDTAKPTAPIGVRFLRTLGYATHLESFGDDVYVASGFFGVDHLSLLDPPNL